MALNALAEPNRLRAAQEVPRDERAWLAALIETAKAQDTPGADRR